MPAASGRRARERDGASHAYVTPLPARLTSSCMRPLARKLPALRFPIFYTHKPRLCTYKLHAVNRDYGRCDKFINFSGSLAFYVSYSFQFLKSLTGTKKYISRAAKNRILLSFKILYQLIRLCKFVHSYKFETHIIVISRANCVNNFLGEAVDCTEAHKTLKTGNSVIHYILFFLCKLYFRKKKKLTLLHGKITKFHFRIRKITIIKISAFKN